MRKFIKALLLSAVATGIAALILEQLDLESAQLDPGDEFPGPDPENLQEEDVESLLNELAAQL